MKDNRTPDRRPPASRRSPPPRASGAAKTTVNNKSHATRTGQPPVGNNKTQNKKQIKKSTPQTKSRAAKDYRADVRRAEINRKLKSQTPSRRKQERIIKKLDPVQLEIKRRKAEQMKFFIKKKRSAAIKLFLRRLTAFFVLFIISFIFVTICFFINLYSHANVNAAKYTYQTGADEDKDKIVEKVNHKTLYKNNEVYVNMSKLAEIYEFVITGDKNVVRVMLPGGAGSTAKFYIGTTLADVNGIKIRLTSPSYLINDSVYVPMKFIADYVWGLDVLYSVSALKLTIKRTPPGSERSGDIRFALSLSAPITNIPEITLRPDIYALTDPNRTEDDGAANGG